MKGTSRLHTAKSRKKPGDYGYLTEKRKRQWISTAAGIIAVAGIYLAGYLIWKGNANILTMFAVLLVLPTVKAFVGLYILLPHKPLSRADVEKAGAAAPGHMLYDVILSSTETISYLPAVYCCDTTVYAFVNEAKIEKEKLETYLREIMTAKREGDLSAVVKTVKVFDDWDAFVKRSAGDVKVYDGTNEKNEADIRHVLQVYSV